MRRKQKRRKQKRRAKHDSSSIPTEPGAEATRLKLQLPESISFSRVASAPGSVGIEELAHQALKAQVQAARDAFGVADFLLGEQTLVKQAQAEALRDVEVDVEFGARRGQNRAVFGLQARQMR